MDTATLLGTAGTAIMAIRGLPQLIRFWWTRDVDGVPPSTMWLMTLMGFGWTAHGLIQQLWMLAAANLIFALVYLPIAAGHPKRHDPRGWAVVGAWIIYTAVLLTIAGPDNLGWIMAPNTLWVVIPQLRQLLNGRHTGISVSTELIRAAECTLWISYGILVGDGPTILNMTIGLALAAAVNGLVWHHRHKQPTVGVPQPPVPAVQTTQ